MIKLSKKIQIKPHDIQLWFISLKESDHRIDLLSFSERERADRFKVAKVRQRYIARTIALRKILGCYLASNPEDIDFVYGKHGKPFLAGDAALQFNLSHAHDKVVIAISASSELGIDIEYCDSSIEILALAERFFHMSEYQQLCQLDVAQRLAAFYKIWALKEAFIKATGEGLSFGLDNFAVDFAAKLMNCLVSVEREPGLVVPSRLGLLQSPWPNYQAALASCGNIESISVHDFSSNSAFVNF